MKEVPVLIFDKESSRPMFYASNLRTAAIIIKPQKVASLSNMLRVRHSCFFEKYFIQRSDGTENLSMFRCLSYSYDKIICQITGKEWPTLCKLVASCNLKDTNRAFDAANHQLEYEGYLPRFVDLMSDQEREEARKPKTQSEAKRILAKKGQKVSNQMIARISTLPVHATPTITVLEPPQETVRLLIAQLVGGRTIMTEADHLALQERAAKAFSVSLSDAEIRKILHK